MGGWRQRRPFLVTLPSVGVTVSDVFVAVCVKNSPIRLTGVYRVRLDALDATYRRRALRVASEEARRVLRAPTGTPVVLALGPTEHRVDLSLDGGWGRWSVPVRADPDAVSGLVDAGFAIERFDALPAAVARFGWCVAAGPATSCAAGWSVTVAADELQATAATRRSGARPGRSGRRDPMPDLRGVRLPNPVRRHLRPDLDAGAIGAALRAFGIHPDLMVDAVDHPPPTISVGQESAVSTTLRSTM